MLVTHHTCKTQLPMWSRHSIWPSCFVTATLAPAPHDRNAETARSITPMEEGGLDALFLLLGMGEAGYSVPCPQCSARN